MRNVIQTDPDSPEISYILIDSPRHGRKVVTIDTNDVEAVKRVKWYVNKQAERAQGRQFIVRGYLNGRPVLLHRYLLSPGESDQVDHIDGSPLNNRRYNLRLASNQENSQNQVGARGYYWHRAKQKWLAQIMINGRPLYLSYFTIEVQARIAYLEAKMLYHPSCPQHYRDELEHLKALTPAEAASWTWANRFPQ